MEILTKTLESGNSGSNDSFTFTPRYPLERYKYFTSDVSRRTVSRWTLRLLSLFMALNRSVTFEKRTDFTFVGLKAVSIGLSG